VVKKGLTSSSWNREIGVTVIESRKLKVSAMDFDFLRTKDGEEEQRADAV
jgi:hypothetical protein